MEKKTKTGKIMLLHPMIDLADYFREFITESNIEDVEVVSLTKGPRIGNGREDHALNAGEQIIAMKNGEKAGYDAICMTCHGDPNIYASRSAVSIPVVGTMEIAMHFCTMLAGRFSILVPTPEIQRWQEDNAIMYGFQSRVASIRLVRHEIPFDEVAQLSRRKPIPEEAMAPVLNEAIKAIQDDDARAITFGCGAFMRMRDELDRRLKERGFQVTVITPLPLAIDVAKMLVKHKLTHSPATYPRH